MTTAVPTKKPSNKNLLTKAYKSSSADKRPQAHTLYRPLLKWYDNFGRHDLPWMQNPSPYTTWLSEIMLQQTQVRTVIPYFYRFIEHFPTIEQLALANSDQVLALWSGLGYYARARNLHRAAQLIVSTYAGIFPHTLEALIQLPGIGRSTAGAIIAQSFHQFGVILDGNVKRVLTRYLTLQPIQSQPAKQFESLLWEYATHFTPKGPDLHLIADYTQAIMDLGATLCTRTKPTCDVCPLNKKCLAYAHQSQALYPVKPLKKIKPTRQAKWLILLSLSSAKNNPLPEVFLTQQPSKGLWGDLWCFPEYPVISPPPSPKNMTQWLKKVALLECATDLSSSSKLSMSTLGMASHIFTHFKLEYESIMISFTGKRPKLLASQRAKWYNPLEIHHVGLPSPVTKILNEIGFFTHDNLLPKTQTRT